MPEKEKRTWDSPGGGTGEKALWALVLVLFLILAYRGYGYYPSDQISPPETGGPTAFAIRSQNPHPPLLMVALWAAQSATGFFLAPVLVQQACLCAALLLLLAAQRRSLLRKPALRERGALVLLFFLIPFTHQAALFIDIDNTLLVAWGALLLWTLCAGLPPVRAAAVTGAVFALGLWCKLTTPPAVFLMWAGVLLAADWRGNWRRVLGGGGVAAILFSATYFPFCHWAHVSAGLPFQLTFGKFFSHLGGGGAALRLGNALRTLFIDQHFFSFVLLPLALVNTAADLRRFSGRRRDLPELFPCLFFWGLYLGYTVAVPTMYLPRYKFGLLPFAVWWLWPAWMEFLGEVTRKKALGLAAAALLLVFLMPDLPTSAHQWELRYHSFALFPGHARYYPEWFMQALGALGGWAKGHWYGLPFRGLGYVTYYFSWLGIALLFIHLAAAGLVKRRFGNSWRNGFFAVGAAVWAALFVQDQSREYQLFYSAGTRGFPETVAYLRENLEPGEEFFGWKDLAFYTGRPSCDLSTWSKGVRADTGRIDSISRLRPLRYLAYLEDDYYKGDTALAAYLERRFTLEKRIFDYRVYRRKSGGEIHSP